MSVEDVGTLTAPAPASSPPRPGTVPPDATWNELSLEWELAPRDASGRPHGLVRAWRRDGSLSNEYEHRAGQRHGAFRRFHPDGSVAREGLFVDNAQDGLTIAYGYDGPGVTQEPMQSCCVPPGAWQLQHEWEHGRLRETRWYDRRGVHLLPSGAPHPVRPEGVPRAASFEEQSDQWVYYEYDNDGVPSGVWRRWSRAGVLRDRDEYLAGKAHGLWQRWDAGGALTQEGEWRGGVRTGPYRRIGLPADFYADARVHEERGLFDRDQSVGAWTLLDAAGAALGAFELGAALDEEALRSSPALADAATPPAKTTDWRDLAQALEAERRPAEALVAWARASAAAGDASPLREALARLALPRKAESALAMAMDLIKRADGRLDLAANGLAAGADAASLLRALSSSLTDREAVSLELVDAALLLAPERADCHVTRALIAIHLGRPEVGLAEAVALPPEYEEQRAFLEGYIRVIFSRFPFAPAGLELRTTFPDVPAGPEQPLENVRAQIQKYATRLAQLRAAVVARMPPGAAPPWLPPDPSALLPDGPVSLETWDFDEIVVDEGASAGPGAPPDAEPPPPESKLVTVDETLTIEASTPLPTLLRQARRDWTGLCWMCWGVGLDRVVLPEAIAARADFGAAAGLSIERLWRCRDRIITCGLRAMTQGVPGFEWEGIDIDLVPALLAEIAADEFREMRAVFYWLCDAGVQSPWQANVRTLD
ncbi:MAG TPA: hypothetical protein VG319_05550 [Polyangia bacterium]|jgi:hypothetical protein|nr:hypothetical protein [Polyangia bacterium]